jgi:hypothetical protein
MFRNFLFMQIIKNIVYQSKKIIKIIIQQCHKKSDTEYFSNRRYLILTFIYNARGCVYFSTNSWPNIFIFRDISTECCTAMKSNGHAIVKELNHYNYYHNCHIIPVPNQRSRPTISSIKYLEISPSKSKYKDDVKYLCL